MRVLDISVAALIGLSSVTALAAWNPNQLSAEGRLYAEQASMKEYLFRTAATLGLPWLQEAGSSAICEALLSYSNSTLQISARGRYFLCSTGPPAGAPMASITLQFPKGNLTLQAWRLGRA